jgi:hypothetical protein
MCDRHTYSQRWLTKASFTTVGAPRVANFSKTVGAVLSLGAVLRTAIRCQHGLRGQTVPLTISGHNSYTTARSKNR